MKNKLGLSVLAAGLSVLALATPALAATISTQMDIGTRGSDVSTLQSTLAADASLYPEGLVTGYFGSLSSAAVRRFQANNGVVSSGSPSTTGYGRVGPATIAKFNAVYGGGNTSADIDAPVLSIPSTSASNNGMSIFWTTSEPSNGIVFYSTSPLVLHENSNPNLAPSVSGNNVLSVSTGSNTSSSVLLGGLSSHTTYYYMVQVSDSSNNISVSWPSTFTTN